MDLGIAIELLAWTLFGFKGKKKTEISVPITLVDHTEDDDWQFFSGNYLTKVRISSLQEAIENDSTVKTLQDLPIGFSAERKTTNAAWVRFRKSEWEHYPERRLPL